MSHAVHFQDAAGELRLEDVASLAAALERVEALRNSDGATAIRVFREVPIEVRTYYRVVAVAEDGAGDPAPSAHQDAEPAVEHAQQVAQAEVTSPSEAAQVDQPGADQPADAQPAAQHTVSQVPMEPPSGAMVMSRQPAAAAEAPGASSDDTAHHDSRRLFSRSS